MKHILPFFLLGLLSTSLFAQNILVWDENGNALNNNTAITIHEESGHTDIFADFDVKNNGSSTAGIMCKKTEISLTAGSSNTFCWGLCFPPHVFVSPSPVNLAAGQLDTISFLGEYYSNGFTGTSRIAYTFYNETNTDDSIRILVDYAYNVTGLGDLFARGEFRFSDAYPNPASSYTRFDYDLPLGMASELRILNLLGSEISRLPLEGGSGSVQVNVADLTEGVYFYALIVGGEAITTRKLIVRR